MTTTECPTPETDKLVEQWDFSPTPKVMEAHARRLERERDELLGVLGDIANMPEYDQDDAHRLRHHARAAISKAKGSL